MREQDEDLTELGQGVDRLQELGEGINQELKVQNKMLSDLDQDIEEVTTIYIYSCICLKHGLSLSLSVEGLTHITALSICLFLYLSYLVAV